MAGGLKDVKARLKEYMREAWATTEGAEVKIALEGAAKAAGIAGKEGKYAAAMRKPGAVPAEEFRKVAGEVDLGDKYAGAWVTEHAPALRATLRDRALGSWTISDREELEALIERLDIPRLYKLCMQGRFDEVAAAIGGPAPRTGQECFARVAEAKKLSEEIRAAWAA